MSDRATKRPSDGPTKGQCSRRGFQRAWRRRRYPIASRHAPAFTLAELIVVVIILSVAAGMIAPRLVRRDSREGENAAERCAELLRAAARRASIGAGAVAIEHDERANVLRVLTPTQGEGFTQSWAQRVRWRIDPLIPPVVMAPLTLEEFLVDGRRTRAGDRWGVLGAGGASSITLTLRGGEAKGQGSAWRVHADTSSGNIEFVDMRSPAGLGSGVATRGTGRPPGPSMVDLDAAGLRDTPW